MAAKRCIRLISLLYFIFLYANNTLMAEDITPTIAWKEAKANELVIIDVRTVNEWNKTGIIPGSVLINMHDNSFSERKNFLSDIEEVISDKPEKKIAIICASGGRSSITMNALISKGYKNIYNISGGILGKQDKEKFPGWVNLKLPIEECNNKCVD